VALLLQNAQLGLSHTENGTPQCQDKKLANDVAN